MRTDNSAIQPIKDWWKNLSKYLNWGGRPKQKKYDSNIAYSLLEIANLAVWSTQSTIDIDVLSWIKGNFEDLIDKRVSEVNIINGEALRRFITRCQTHHQYTDIPHSVIRILSNSVILVAVDDFGNITYAQMIRSKNGIYTYFQEQFKGQPILKIKITT